MRPVFRGVPYVVQSEFGSAVVLGGSGAGPGLGARGPLATTLVVIAIAAFISGMAPAAEVVAWASTTLLVPPAWLWRVTLSRG